MSFIGDRLYIPFTNMAVLGHNDGKVSGHRCYGRLIKVDKQNVETYRSMKTDINLKIERINITC